MLSVSGGRLLIDGQQCREVGWNCYFEFLKTLANNNDLTYQASLAKLSEYNVRVIRCLITPLWAGGTGGWGTYDTAGGMNATYYSLLDAFMDECAANGIQVVMPLIWRHATLPDLFSETVNQIGTAGSSSLVYAASFAAEIVARYKDHAACGAWQIGNEWVPYAQAGTLPTTNVGNGTPASYSAPDDQITPDQLRFAIATISSAIRTVDPDRAILGAASRPLTAIPTTKPTTFSGQMITADSYNTGAVDVCGLHIYPDGHYGPDGYYGLKEYCTLNRSAARRRPLVVDEIGLAEDFSGDFDSSWDELKSLIADPDGPELTLLWNWGNPNTWANGDTDWDVYPGVNREYQADAVRDVQGRTISPTRASGPLFTPKQWCRFGGGSSTPDCVYLPSGTVAKTDDWTVTFWFRYRGTVPGGTFWRIISFSDESSEGFFVQRHTDGRVYAQVRLASGNINTYNMAPANAVNRWIHHAISWNSTTGKIRHVVNGRYTVADVTHAAAYTKGTDKNFVVGASQSLGSGVSGDLFDVRLYDQPLNMPAIWQTTQAKATSIDPVVRLLYEGIDSSLTIQGTPEWMGNQVRTIDTTRQLLSSVSTSNRGVFV